MTLQNKNKKKMLKEEQNTSHIPVMIDQVLTYLAPREGDSYLDLTAGYGGHAAAILAHTRRSQVVLIDRDQAAVVRLKARFAGQGIAVWRTDFLSASQRLAAAGQQFDCILADLGVSSLHLNQASRGFSIQRDGPLDMRMDQRQSLTAETIVNGYSEMALKDILRRYGEEPKAAAIAGRIVANRPLHTTKELAAIVAKAWPIHSRLHPATRTFQALRIAVNNEIELLRNALPIWIHNLLAPDGRLVVISFHSLEDRLVKAAFQDAGGDRYDAILRILTRRPVVGEKNEIVSNPRARSAKLRAAVKINK
ncbi:MAG TPA: 16S rRNA (cytosine(1402)-N(4))-methyltransferase RsmH [Candidatus Saccharimonadales bacterium]|nr:16S rRNA (cytosine(1402)-N(4))-methyltransferase RsmH [Candidatus Saccharimonadales bacterium]